MTLVFASNNLSPGTLTFAESKGLVDFLVASGRTQPFSLWLDSAEPELSQLAAGARAERFLRQLKGVF